MTRPRITIVFPPAADPSLPYGALPLLGASLKRGGYPDVSLRDVNLEAFDALLDPDVLRRAIDGAALSPGLDAVAAEAVSNIVEAKRILRDPVDFYDPARLLFAKRIFHLAGTVVTARYPHLRFGKYSYSSSAYDSFADIEHALRTDAGPLGEYFQNAVAPSLLATHPDVIGVSVPYFSQLIPAFLLAQIIRDQDSTVHITFGGPVITWGSEVLASDHRFSRWLDSYFLGEAEETFLRFVEALDGRGDLGAVPNMVRYVDDEVVSQTDPQYQLSLDWSPAPDYTTLPLKDYFAPDRIICLTPTRGCYYNQCAFCNYAFIKLAPYRARAPALIAEDVATVVQSTGEHVFCFESDVMLPVHLHAISNALIAAELDIAWHSVARFEKGFTREIFAAMRKAGCVRLYMGLESANDRVLEAMKKGTTAARMAEILTMCHETGIAVEAGVFNGFPSETLAEAEDTYDFILRHRDVIGRADVGTFRLLKGAPIADEPGLYGIAVRDEPHRRWYHLAFNDPTPRPDTGSATAAERIQRLYPEVALIDVPEDILYTARHGPHAFRRFFSWPGGLAAGTQPGDTRPVADTDTLRMPSAYEIQRADVTNSGAVHFGLEGAAGPHPAFEASSYSVAMLVDHQRSAVHPLSPVAEAVLRCVAGAGRSLGDVCTRLSPDHEGATVRTAIHRLVAAGLLDIA